MLHIIQATNLDFMKLAKPAFIISWLIIAVGSVLAFTAANMPLVSTFSVATSSIFRLLKKMDVDQVRGTLTAAGIKDARIQYQKDLATGRETLRVGFFPRGWRKGA